ncbi:MAG: hypothetical protein QXE12_03890 [Conexivisphaerales archaeon]
MSHLPRPCNQDIAGEISTMKFDVSLTIIIIITIITVAGFSVAIANYPNSESYPPWVHAQTSKPAIIAVPVINGTNPNVAVLYDAYGNSLYNMTLISSNSTYSLFSTGNYRIVPGYAYKVWVPQENIVYDFGLQPPSISQLKSTYYHVVLNINFQDEYWRPIQ